MVTRRIFPAILLSLLIASCTDTLDVEIKTLDQDIFDVQFNGFEASGIRPVLKWQWDFGVSGTDDDVSTEQSPTFRFPAPGNYLVHLYAYSRAGYGSASKTISICPSTLPVEYKPTCDGIQIILHQANFTKDVTIRSACEDQTHRETRDTIFNIKCTVPGTYPIHLTIDPRGCQTIEIDHTIDFKIQPSAMLSSSRIGKSIDFVDESAGSVNYWFWEFGDGATSNEQFPTHEYLSAGTYPVKLTVGGDCVPSDVETSTVIIPDHIGEAFSVPYRPNGLFSVDAPGLVRVAPYEYRILGRRYQALADELPIFEFPRVEKVDTHSVTPYFFWDAGVHGKNTMVVISTKRFEIKDGQIMNMDDLVWGWNSSLRGISTAGSVHYMDGRIFINGELKHDNPTAPPLMPDETYYWCIYAWDDHFNRVEYCSREYPFVAYP